MPASTPQKPAMQLRVVRADGGPETVVALTADQLICGRAAEVSLPDDPFVADRQARFFFRNSRLAVEDMAGGNGVFLRLRQEAPLTAGAEVRIGRQRLRLEVLTPPAPGPDGTVAWGSPDPGYRFRLVQLLEGGAAAAAHLLGDGEHRLGRDAGEVIFPIDGFVSGRHAVVRVAGPQVSVKDVGSSNGTFVRIAAPCALEVGDQLLIGRQLVRVEARP